MSKYVPVAELRVRHSKEWQEQRAQKDRELIDAVITEFGCYTDPAMAMGKMAEEILYWRGRMGQIIEVVAKVETEEPFAIVGAGPYWEPGKRKPGWWR